MEDGPNRSSQDNSTALVNGPTYRDSSGKAQRQERHPVKEHKLLRSFATHAALVPMAFFGVLIRLGVEALGDCEYRITDYVL